MEPPPPTVGTHTQCSRFCFSFLCGSSTLLFFWFFMTHRQCKLCNIVWPAVHATRVPSAMIHAITVHRLMSHGRQLVRQRSRPWLFLYKFPKANDIYIFSIYRKKKKEISYMYVKKRSKGFNKISRNNWWKRLSYQPSAFTVRCKCAVEKQAMRDPPNALPRNVPGCRPIFPS